MGLMGRQKCQKKHEDVELSGKNKPECDHVIIASQKSSRQL
jgi:hypothetical protein